MVTDLPCLVGTCVPTRSYIAIVRLGSVEVNKRCLLSYPESVPMRQPVNLLESSNPLACLPYISCTFVHQTL